MTFSGLLLKESLKDPAVLDSLTITQTETWEVERPAGWQPGLWTAVTFEGPEAEADAVAARISRAIDSRWYANLSTEHDTIVIFHDRVFRYRRGDPVQRDLAQQYARAIGVPAWQIDWGE